MSALLSSLAINPQRLMISLGCSSIIRFIAERLMSPQFREVHGRAIFQKELESAVSGILQVTNLKFKSYPLHETELYQILVRIALCRVKNKTKDKSQKPQQELDLCQMRWTDLYQYTVNLNAWAGRELQEQYFVHIQKNLILFYGPKITKFKLTPVEYGLSERQSVVFFS